jgi:phosphoribosyl-ATP pyrophosphohydrolase/phosphoribosyl-AMP cyclohydrolase
LLHELDSLIASRKGADTNESYTASLFAKGLKRVAQKVGEEGVEVALAAATADKDELANESADLLYHLLVALRANELSLDDVLEVLAKRRG